MSNLPIWHEIVENEDSKKLKSLVTKDAVFYSPIVFKPQEGRMLVATYLLAAARVLKSGGFKYVKELDDGLHSILEFQAEIDGVKIEGVDIITWNDENQIVEFKVMLRPFRAIEKVGEKMKAELSNMSLLDKALFAIKS